MTCSVSVFSQTRAENYYNHTLLCTKQLIHTHTYSRGSSRGNGYLANYLGAASEHAVQLLSVRPQVWRINHRPPGAKLVLHNRRFFVRSVAAEHGASLPPSVTVSEEAKRPGHVAGGGRVRLSRTMGLPRSELGPRLALWLGKG